MSSVAQSRAQVDYKLRLGPAAATRPKVGSSGGLSVLISASVRSSGTTRICCGRNIGLISGYFSDRTSVAAVPTVASRIQAPLLAVVWIFPPTILKVDPYARTKLPFEPPSDARLGAPRPSLPELHGTSGALAFLPASNEFLGLAHFHRQPPKSTRMKAPHRESVMQWALPCQMVNAAMPDVQRASSLCLYLRWVWPSCDRVLREGASLGDALLA